MHRLQLPEHAPVPARGWSLRATAVLLLGALTALPAHAGSLDRLEVGGLEGTVAGTNPSAVWWNPAMMSEAEGTDVLLELGLNIGGQRITRQDEFFPGEEYYGALSPLPFIGVRTDAGVRGLGIGFGIEVPYARGGTADSEKAGERGPLGTSLVDALILAAHVSGGVSYSPVKQFGFGVTGHYIFSSYRSVTDASTLPDLADTIIAEAPFLGSQENLYDRSQLEDPDYLTRTEFGALRGHGGAVTVGLFVKPIDQLTISASWYSGARIVHRGAMRFTMGCPPQTDIIGRLGTEREGLCDARVSGTGSNTYTYPMRLNLGIALQATPNARIELMGGWVNWKRFTEYYFRFNDDLTSENTELTELGAANLSGDRIMARDNVNNFWIAVDGQFDLSDIVKLRARAAFDKSAIPNTVLAPNNADFDTIKLGIGADFRLGRESKFYIGVSFLEEIWLARTNTENIFRLELDPEKRPAARYHYPTMNGEYRGALHRPALSFGGSFPGKKAR